MSFNHVSIFHQSPSSRWPQHTAPQTRNTEFPTKQFFHWSILHKVREEGESVVSRMPGVPPTRRIPCLPVRATMNVGGDIRTTNEGFEVVCRRCCRWSRGLCPSGSKMRLLKKVKFWLFFRNFLFPFFCKFMVILIPYRRRRRIEVHLRFDWVGERHDNICAFPSKAM